MPALMTTWPTSFSILCSFRRAPIVRAGWYYLLLTKSTAPGGADRTWSGNYLWSIVSNIGLSNSGRMRSGLLNPYGHYVSTAPERLQNRTTGWRRWAPLLVSRYWTTSWHAAGLRDSGHSES